jgi:hypothetical protein
MEIEHFLNRVSPIHIKNTVWLKRSSANDVLLDPSLTTYYAVNDIDAVLLWGNSDDFLILIQLSSIPSRRDS